MEFHEKFQKLRKSRGLILLPLYPNPENGHIYSVNLFAFAETTLLNKVVYWILFLILIAVGVIKIIVIKLELVKLQKTVTVFSMAASVLTVLFLAMAKEPYAITIAFVLFIIKGILLLMHTKNCMDR